MLKEEKESVVHLSNDKLDRFLYLTANGISVSAILLSSTTWEEKELGSI